MVGVLGRLLHGHSKPPADPQVSFAGQNVIVTGSNVGLGFEAALKFVQKGAALVVLGVRSLEKGEKAKSDIEKRTDKKNVVEVWQLDMLDYDSIKKFSERASNLNHLDIVLLNAGFFPTKFQRSRYGWEETIQVNHISTVFLGTLLLPKLKASKTEKHAPVLLFINSGTHTQKPLTPPVKSAQNILDAVNKPQGFKPTRSYGISKLFLMYAVQTLASQTKPSHVLITAACPGMCKSELFRDYNGAVMRMFKWILFALIAREPEEGSRTLVSGTTLGHEAHGRFWQHDKIQEKDSLLTGDEGEKLQAKVWRETIEALNKDVPEITDFVPR